MSTTSVLTIYPTALKVEDVLKARARAGDVSLGHRLTTFPELVDALDRENVGAPPIVSEALAIVLVQEALVEVLGDEALDERPGLARAVRRTIGELAAACIGPRELTAIAHVTSVDDAGRRLRWLARVGEAYALRLSRLDRADRHARERRVLELLHRHETAVTRPRTLVGVTRLVIAEIYDYSPVQSLIARALIRLVGDAELVTLAHGENVDATRFVERTWNRFVEDPEIADKVLPDFVVRGGRGGTLSRVLTGLFVEPKPPTGVAADESVRVVAAGSRAAEVEEIGRRIHGALAAGVAPERIAVLARDVAAYRPLLEDVARRYRLPLALTAPRPLAAHAGVQTVLRLLCAVVDGLPRDALGGALASPYLRAAPRGVRRLLETVGYVDTATLPLARCLVLAEARFTDVANGAAAARARDRAARALRQIRRDGQAVVAVTRRLGGLDEARSLAGHAAEVLAILGDLGLGLPAVDVTPGERATEGPALAALAQFLGDVGALGAASRRARRGSLASFLARLVEAIEMIDVEAPGPVAAGVRVLPIADARGLDLDTTFVLGLDDGSFPAPLTEDALLGDGVRREVNRHAPALVRATLGQAAEGAPLGRLLRSSVDRAAEDPFLFYLALSTAERSVVVTYPTRDERGDALVRSPFVDEVVTIAGDEVLAAPADYGGTPSVTAATDGGELLRAAVVAAAADRPGLLAAVGARLPPGTLVGLVTRIVTARRRERYFLLDREHDPAAKEALADAFVGRLPIDAARAQRLRAMEWSASRLDELGACGFKFFAHRLLHLEAADAADEALDAREEGTLVHRLLEVVLRRCDPLPADSDAAATAVRAIAAEHRTAITRELRITDAQLFALAWSRAVEAVVELVRDESAAPATGTRRLLEWPFRFILTDPRPISADGRLDLTLTGVVDRVDLQIDGDGRVIGATVLDYKNSKREREYAARVDVARAMGTTSFQIPVYALALTAAADLRWAEDAEIRGGYILLRAGRKPLVRPIAPAWLARSVPAGSAGEDPPPSFATRIVALVEAAAAGRFDVEPRECSRFCTYRQVCRYEPPPEEAE